MRALTLTALAALAFIGAVAINPAKAGSCYTTCQRYGNQTQCNTNCY